MAYYKTTWNPWGDPIFTYHTKTNSTSEYSEITKETFDSDNNRRILQYIEVFKVKKGSFKNKKVKVIHKGKYKVSNDKKNGRPKLWIIAVKGKGLSDAAATDLYNNKSWLLKPTSRTEVWEPLPGDLSAPSWWYSSYEQYGGKLSDTGEVIDVDPAIDSLTINWTSHDSNAPLEQTDQKEISSDMSNNITKLKAAGEPYDVLYEWSVNGTVTPNSTTSSINIAASEYNTGDIISLRCFLGDSSSSAGVWKDADETITLNITPLPVIEAPQDPGDKAAVTTDDGISLEAEVEGVDGNKTLDFDGIENVNIVATKNDVTVKDGGDIIPEENTSIELSGGLDPLPPVELPGESEDDYILLRFNPTNEVIIPIMEWYELKLGPDIEIDWDYAGDGDVETFNLDSAVPIPVDNVNTDMSSYFGQYELDNWRSKAPVPAPVEWTEHENWTTTQPADDGWTYAKFGWSTETSELSQFRRDILNNSKRIRFDLYNPSTSDKTVGYVGAWKRWTGPAKPRTVLIRTKNMVRSYGITYRGYNDGTVHDMIMESNSKINFIKIKGCGNVTDWGNSFSTLRVYTPVSPSYSPEAKQEELRPDLVVDLTQMMVDRCTTFRDMFMYSRIKEIDLSTLKSIYIGCDFGNMFLGCSRLESVKLPKSYIHVDSNPNVDLEYMFYKCTSLTTIDITPFIDLFKHKAGCTAMFSDCTSLSSVDMTDISFYGCMTQRMFSNCTSLETIIGWNTVSSLIWSIGNIPNEMFKNCSKLNDDMINFNNWILVEDAYLANEGFSMTINTATINKWISDGYEIAPNSGITANIDTSNMRKRGDSDCIISNKTFSSPDWKNSLQLEIDLNMSPNRHHEKSWTNGTDMSSSSNDEEFFNIVPWNKNTVELCFGAGIGYNENIFDVMIDWGDGIIERHSTFNGGTDDRYIDNEYFAQQGRDRSQTGHTIVTHKYVSSGKRKTIKILGFCTDALYLGELFLRDTRQINGSSQWIWKLPNMRFVLKGIKSAGTPEGFTCPDLRLNTFNLSVAPGTLNSCLPIAWYTGLFHLNAEPYDNIIENVESKFADWFNIDKFTQSWLTFGGVEQWPESENSKYTLVDSAPKRSWSTYYNSAASYTSKGYMNINGDMVWHKPYSNKYVLAHAKYIDTIIDNWVVSPGRSPAGNIWGNTVVYGNQLFYSV